VLNGSAQRVDGSRGTTGTSWTTSDKQGPPGSEAALAPEDTAAG